MKPVKCAGQIRGDCAGQIWGDYNYRRCDNKGSVKEAGKWWCKTHAPSLEKKRREERDRKWQAQWDAERKERDLQDKIKTVRNQIVKAVVALPVQPTGELRQLVEQLNNLEAS